MRRFPDLSRRALARLGLAFGAAYDQTEGPTIFGTSPPYLPLAARPDVPVFETEPLSDDVEVTGAISATLWISSDFPDSDFTLKLIDVNPKTGGPEGSGGAYKVAFNHLFMDKDRASQVTLPIIPARG